MLRLPPEMRQQIFEYALDDYEQILSICHCQKRACLIYRQSFRLTLHRTSDPKLKLVLVSKQVAAEVHGIKPAKVTLIACSLRSLTDALATKVVGVEDRLRNVVVSMRRKLPVDVCDFNSGMLSRTAGIWFRILVLDCVDILLESGYDVVDKFHETYWTFEADRSMTEQQVMLNVTTFTPSAERGQMVK